MFIYFPIDGHNYHFKRCCNEYPCTCLFLNKRGKKLLLHTYFLRCPVLIASFPIIIPASLAHRILGTQCDNEEQSNLENVKTGHVIATVGKLELACLGCLFQPSAHTAGSPTPIHVVLLVLVSAAAPTHLMWAKLAYGINPILSHSWPWQVQIGPPDTQTSRKEKEYIIAMK